MKLISKSILKEITNVPNLISLFRLTLAIPFYFLLPLINDNYIYRIVIMSLIIIAFISDLLDGYIARKQNITTEMGKILDPLADKLLVIIIITQLFLNDVILEFYFWIILLRDIFIFTGGIVVSKKIGRVLPSNIIGKITVFSIGIYIIIVLLDIPKSDIFYHITFYLSIILSLLSVIVYFIRALEVMRWSKNEVIR